MESKESEKQSPTIQITETEVGDLSAQESWHGGPIVPPIKEWDEDVQLKKTGILHWVANLLYLIFPGAFIGLTVVIAAIHNRPVGNGSLQGVDLLKREALYWSILQAVTVAVTLYPIAFGLILCKLLKTVTNYTAERGASLITLEQLIATKSFGSALTVPFNFKRLDKTSFVLLALWITSPFTSQALQRMLTTGTNTVTVSQETVYYLDYLASEPSLLVSQFSYLTQGNFSAKFRDIPTTSVPSSLLQDLFLASTYQSSDAGQDIFGNLKIPLFSTIQGQLEPDADGWYDLSAQSFWPFSWGKSSFAAETLDTALNASSTNTSTWRWSSLSGLPLGNVHRNSSAYSVLSNFTASTGYWNFACEKPSLIGEAAFNTTLNPNGLGEWLPNCNIDIELRGKPYTDALAACSLVALPTCAFKLEPSDETVGNQQEIRFISESMFGANNHGGKFWASTTCALSRQAVEIDVTCAGDSCATSRIRQGPQLTNMGLETFCAQPITGIEGNTIGCAVNVTPRNFITGMLSNFIKSAGKPYAANDLNKYYNSPLEVWLSDPTLLGKSPQIGGNGVDSFVHLDELSADKLSQRLTEAFNGFYELSMGYTTFGNGIPQEEWKQPFFNLKNGSSTVRKTQAVYKAAWGWVAVVWISCALVIALIVLNAVLQHKTLAPDLLGYVSTLTYNNRFVPLPPGGNALDAVDRTRKLADLKVRILDVSPGGERGHIALSTVPGAPLRPGRKYA